MTNFGCFIDLAFIFFFSFFFAFSVAGVSAAGAPLACCIELAEATAASFASVPVPGTFCGGSRMSGPPALSVSRLCGAGASAASTLSVMMVFDLGLGSTLPDMA